MTTIKPLTGGINLEVRHIGGDGHALINVGPLPKPSVGGYVSEQSARYPMADLLAALDAVPKMPEKPPMADRERDLLGPQNDDGRYWHRRAMENLRKAELATTRAEKAEAKLAEAATQRDEFEAEKDGAWAEVRRLTAERDALAATVERVREAAAIWGEGFRAAVLAAINPEPFTLPTEAGVRFYAEDPEGDSFVFKTLIGGREPLYIADDDQDQVCNADELTGWQNFRLLDGAE